LLENVSLVLAIKPPISVINLRIIFSDIPKNKEIDKTSEYSGTVSFGKKTGKHMFLNKKNKLKNESLLENRLKKFARLREKYCKFKL